MNELMVVYSQYKWLYYKTEQKTAKEAYKEFEQKVEALGVDFSMMSPIKATLRDEDGDDIDSFKEI